MKAALLPDRGVVRITGEPARDFLNGLLTADITAVTADRAAYAALLTPQGKMVVDFLLVEAPSAGGFLFDCPRDLAGTLVQKLNFYKLRAKVTIEDLSDTLGIVAIWNEGETVDGPGFADPRLPALGRRVPHDYEAHRIALAVPRGGLDFTYGDAFPHEADMDQLAGVDFAKGCYVGQEVVSRMQHRATARTRVVPLAYEGFAPRPGTPVTAGDKVVGTLGSSAAGRALALLRLDRVADALEAGLPLTAGDVTVTPLKPDWAKFAWPGES
jgi:folate-binding protein YgfZ